MEPLNYTLDVLSPFQMAIGGYGAAMDQAQQRQNMGLAVEENRRADEGMTLARDQFGLQQQQFGLAQDEFGLRQQALAAAQAEQEAARQAQLAAAEAEREGIAALTHVIRRGPAATAEEYMIMMAENPAMAQQIGAAFEVFDAERQAGELENGMQVFAALLHNPDEARRILEDRRIAAENAGEPAAAAAAQSLLMQMDTPNGVDTTRTVVGGALARIMGHEAFKAMMETVGVPEADPVSFPVIDGRLIRLNERTGETQVLGEFASPEEATAAQRNYEFLIEQGKTPDEAAAMAFGGGTTVNVGAGETAFERETGAAMAQEASAIVTQGATAQRSLGQLYGLRERLATAPQGALGAITAAAGQFGVDIGGLDEVQATQAIINQLIPSQRPPGSGPMSDRDIELFRQSVPRIANQPGGNRLILDTMIAVAEYDVKRAEIARRLQLGELDMAAAATEYARLGNPIPPELRGSETTEPAALPATAPLEDLLNQYAPVQ